MKTMLVFEVLDGNNYIDNAYVVQLPIEDQSEIVSGCESTNCYQFGRCVVDVTKNQKKIVRVPNEFWSVKGITKLISALRFKTVLFEGSCLPPQGEIAIHKKTAFGLSDWDSQEVPMRYSLFSILFPNSTIFCGATNFFMHT